MLPHPITVLRDVSWEKFEQNKAKINPLAAQRATHIVGGFGGVVNREKTFTQTQEN